MTKKLREFDIREIENDYRPNEDKYFLEEDNLTYQIKNILFSGLSTTERWIFLLYCEKKSLRKTGKILGVSTSKTFQVIRDIRNKIIDQLNDKQCKQ